MEKQKISFKSGVNEFRGSILLVVLGVLAILSLLGTALMTITRRESAEARAYMDAMRAQFASESGLEVALSKLAARKADLVNWPQELATIPSCAATPLAFLKTCTYGSIDTDGDDLKDAAGIISETYAKNGDLYRLRVFESQGRININDSNTPWNIDSDPYEDQWTPERDYAAIPAHLKHPTDKDPDWLYPGQEGYQSWRTLTGREPHPRDPGRMWHIIESLVKILFPNDPNAQLSKQVADAIFEERARRRGQFSSFAEIREILVSKYLTPTQYNLFQSYLTLASWQDPNVLQPTFQWRVNTPPRLDPNDSNSSHVSHYPGDAIFEAAIPDVPQTALYSMRMAPRPGSIDASMTFDFNTSGSMLFSPDGTPVTLQYPGTNCSHVSYTEDVSADETDVKWDHDIYLHTDMQTRYYAVEARSPVNVNSTPKELLTVLISSVQGWYLKEAPSIWDGENPRSRAEDWSQPNISATFFVGNRVVPGFPWSTLSRMGVWDRNKTPIPLTPQVYNPSNLYYSPALFQLPDECQYYYNDFITKNYLTSDPPRITVPFSAYCMKSGRFGELCQSKLFSMPCVNDALTTVAAKLADRIYKRVHVDADGDGVCESFHPFRTWEEFETYLLDLADLEDGTHLTGDLRDFDIYMAHALIANFNPNSRLNDFNPNKRQFLHVDKSQLISNTAELTFGPCGYFSIESLGEVLLPGGQAPITSESFCIASVLETFRVSTQEQFMRGAAAGADRFSESNDLTTTSGAKPGYMGCSLQSYPEIDAPGRFENSRFDGQLMLATYKPSKGEQFDFPLGNQNTNNHFYATFDGALDADFSLGDPLCMKDADSGAWKIDAWRFTRIPPVNYTASDPTAQVPTNASSDMMLTKDLRLGVYDGSRLQDRPGNLLPDGILSDAGRTPVFASFDALGDNAPIQDPANPSQTIPADGRRGTLQFWIKPNFDTAHSNRVRRLFCAPPRSVNGDATTKLNFYTTSHTQDYMRDFSLLYFSRGGPRVPGSDVNDPNSTLDETVNFGYSPVPNDNEGRWLPTRSFFLTVGQQKLNLANAGVAGRIYGTGSTTANQSWRADGVNPDPGLGCLYQFETRQWSHLAIAWDWIGVYAGYNPDGTPAGDAFSVYKAPRRFWSLTINGKNVEEDRDEVQPLMGGSLPLFWGNNYAHRDGIQKLKSAAGPGPSNYFRFGESSSAPYNNHVADATYDDFASSSMVHEEPALQCEYGYGRYYSANDAVYTSPEFDLIRELDLRDDGFLSLVSIMWTSYWPSPAKAEAKAQHPRYNDNRDANLSDAYADLRGITRFGNAYPSDPMSPVNGGNWAGDWVPNSIDIMNPATGNWRYAQEFGFGKKKMPCHAGGSQDLDWESNPLRWDLQAGQKLCFRVHFNIEEGQTLFTSPVFDDITFYFKASAAKILFWERR